MSKMSKLQVIVHPVKKEFQRKSCGFDHDTPDDFVKSQVRIKLRWEGGDGSI